MILEPHFDDAALSCSALLDRSAPVELVTVFGAEPDPPVSGEWDAVCGFADSREALANRRAEQALAFQGSAHRVRSLPLLEAQYLDERPESDGGVIAEAVTTWLARQPDGVVALPAGAGWRAPGIVRLLARLGRARERVRPHPEHLFVRDAALAAPGGWTPLLYEELPYAFWGAAEGAVASVARARAVKPCLVEVPVDRRAKAQRIACYRSQVPLISPPGRPLDDPRFLPAFERYWLLER